MLLFWVLGLIFLVDLGTGNHLIRRMQPHAPVWWDIAAAGWGCLVLGLAVGFFIFKVKALVVGYEDHILVGNKRRIEYSDVKRIRFYPGPGGILVRIKFSTSGGIEHLWFFAEAQQRQQISDAVSPREPTASF
jgi:hypothetical protein